MSWQTMSSFAAEALKHTQQHGVNTLIFEFNPNPEQPGREWDTFLDDLCFDEFAPRVSKTGDARRNAQKLRENIAGLTRSAKSQGIDVYIVVTEFSLPPGMVKAYPEAGDLNSEFIWKFLESRLAEVLRALPDLTGIVLYTDEPADFSVYETKNVDQTAALLRLLNLYHDVCHRYGRKFIVTTFVDYYPVRMKVMLSALNQAPAADDFIVDNYICPGDWGLVRVVNPAIAAVKNHRQFLTFDYTGEIWGQGNLPLCEAELIHDRLKRARDSGATLSGINGYVSWYTQSIFGKPSSINLDLASEFLREPHLDPRTAVYVWLKNRYGAQAAERLTEAFLNSFAMEDKAIESLGFWVAEAPKSAFPPPAWIAYTLRTELLYVWDPQWKATEVRFSNPEMDLLAKVIQEKDEAVALASKGLQAVEDSKPFLRLDDYRLLHQQFILALYVARAFRLYLELYLRFRMWDQSGRGPLPPRMQVLQESIGALIQEMQKAVGSPPVFCPASLSDSLSRLEGYLHGESFPNFSGNVDPAHGSPQVNWNICAPQD